jgi:hypothetical protein
MNHEEALEWLIGIRSMTNMIPQEPRETWLVRIAQADAAMTKQAYWIVKAHADGLLTIKSPVEISSLPGDRFLRLAEAFNNVANDLFIRDAEDKNMGIKSSWNLRGNIMKDISDAMRIAQKKENGK